MGKALLGNPLKLIMAEAGRRSDISNRSYFVKSVNTVLMTGLVKIQVAPKGKVFVPHDKSKKPYDLKVMAGGWNSVVRYGDNMDANDILRTIGKLLLVPEVKEKIKSDVFVPDHCLKCNGLGIIPAFHYYCSGICFDCCGLGCNLKYKISVEVIVPADKNTLKGRKYLNEFHVGKLYTEYFPEGVENIKPILYIGHPTAEKFLGKKDGVYYIHQPVCKCNSWYAIPEVDFQKFKAEFKKVFKIEL